MYARPNGRKGSAIDVIDVVPIVDLKGSMVFPTFVDLHTHTGRHDIAFYFLRKFLQAGSRLLAQKLCLQREC